MNKIRDILMQAVCGISHEKDCCGCIKRVKPSTCPVDYVHTAIMKENVRWFTKGYNQFLKELEGMMPKEYNGERVEDDFAHGYNQAIADLKSSLKKWGEE